MVFSPSGSNEVSIDLEANDNATVEINRVKNALDELGETRGTSSGLERVADAIDNVGDQMGDILSGVTKATSGLQALKNRADAVEDELERVGDEASDASTRVTALGAVSTNTAGAMALMGTVAKLTAIPALGSLVTTLVPLAATVGALGTGLGGVAAGFGAVIGSGAFAYGNKLKKQNKERLKQTKTKIQRLQRIKQETGSLTAEQQKQLKSLKKQKKELSEATTVMGALSKEFAPVREQLRKTGLELGKQFIPLIRDAIDALPQFIRNIQDAIGPLQPFADALRNLGQTAFNVIPEIVAQVMDMGREILPEFVDITNAIMRNVVPALEGMSDTADRVIPLFDGLGEAIVDQIPAINEFGIKVLQTLVPAIGTAIGFYVDIKETIQKEVIPVIEDVASKFVAGGRKMRDQFPVSKIRSNFNKIASKARSLADTFKNEVVPTVNTTADKVADLKDAIVKSVPSIDTIRQKFDKWETKVSDTLDSVAELAGIIAEELLNRINKVVEFILDLNEATDGWLIKGGLAVFTVVSFAKAFGGLVGSIEGAIYFLWKIVGILGGPLTIALGGAALAVVALWEEFDLSFKKIKNVVESVIDDVTGKLEDAGIGFDTLKKGVDTVISDIATFLGKFEDAAKGVAKVAGNQLGNIIDAFGDLKDEAKNLYDSIKEAFDLSESDIESAGKSIERTLQIVGATFVWLINNVVAPAMDTLAWLFRNVIGPAIDLFFKLNKATDGWAGTLLMLGGAVGYLLGPIGGFIKVLGTLAGGIGWVVKAGSALVGFLGGPLTIAILAIAAVVAGLYYAWTENWFGIRDKTDAVIDWITGSIDWFITTIENIISAGIDFITGGWRDAWSGMENFLSNTVSSIERTLRGAWNSIKRFFSNTLDTIERTVRNSFNSAKRLISNTLSDIERVITDSFNAVKRTVRSAMNSVDSTLTNIWSGIESSVENAVNSVKNTVRRTFNDVKRNVDRVWGRIEDTIDSAVERVSDTLDRTFQRAEQTIDDAMDAIESSVDSAFEGMESAVEGATSIIKGTISSAWSSIKGTSSRIWSRIERAVERPIDNIERTIDRTVESIERTIDRTFEGIQDTVDDVWRDVEDTIGESIDGALDSIESTVGGFSDAARDIVDGMTEPFDDLVGDIIDAISDLPDEIMDEFEAAAQDAIDAFNRIMPDEISLPDVEVPSHDIDIPRAEVGLPSELGGGSIGIGGGDFVEEGQMLDLGHGGYDIPELAAGGIVDQTTTAVIGEGSQPEAVMPLDKLGSMMEATFDAGVDKAAGGSQDVNVRLSVEGDDELTRLIRENAEVVVEENDQTKRDRLNRF